MNSLSECEHYMPFDKPSTTLTSPPECFTLKLQNLLRCWSMDFWFCGFLGRSDNVHPFHLWSDSSAMISLFPQLPYFCFSFSMPGFFAQIDKLTMYSDCARRLFQMTFFNCFPLLEFWSFTFVRGVWIRSSLRISFLLVNLASKFSKDPYHRVRFLVLDYSA